MLMCIMLIELELNDIEERPPFHSIYRDESYGLTSLHKHSRYLKSQKRHQQQYYQN